LPGKKNKTPSQPRKQETFMPAALHQADHRGEPVVMQDDGLDQNELTEAMQARLREELAPGERVVWAARPLPGALGPGCGIKTVAILGVVPAAAGAGLLLWAVERRQADERVAFGAGLLVMGLILLALMAWANRVARRAREGTFYVLTDRRAITWVPELGNQVAVRSYYPRDLSGMHRKEDPDGGGSVILAEISMAGQQGVPALQPRGFLGIGRVREVEQLVKDTLLAPRQADG
jgi:hypothetical protein